MKFYIPNNATLVVVGAVKNDDAVALAKKYFSWIPKQPEPPRITVQEPPVTAERSINLKEQNAPSPLVAVLFHIVPQGHPDYIPLQVLSSILCEGNSSHVYRRLVATEQLEVAAQGMIYALEQDGLARHCRRSSAARRRSREGDEGAAGGNRENSRRSR